LDSPTRGSLRDMGMFKISLHERGTIINIGTWVIKLLIKLYALCIDDALYAL
jgi:hypothetical protein